VPEADVRTGEPVVGVEPVVRSDELVVGYGATVAVDRLSFTAAGGEVVALLGPNGAGKTSTVECLEGYRPAKAGTVSVLGFDPGRDRHAVAGRIGVMLQRGGVYPMLGPRRLLRLFAGYYDDPADPDELLARVGLDGVSRTPWRRLSGGEQQRLSLALALVGRPHVLFLDEPTAGVDPEGRLVVRDIVDEQRTVGVCVVLTTHELVEAERLADRVVIIDHGRKLAEGTPAGLAASSAVGEIHFRATAELDLVAMAEALGDGTTVEAEQSGRYRVALPASVGESEGVARLTAWLAREGHTLADLHTGRSLEDAYLAITRAGGPPGTAEAPPTPAVDTVDAADAVETVETVDAADVLAGSASGGVPGAAPPGGRGPERAPREKGATASTSAHRRRALGGRPLMAQLRAELFMMTSNGETLLLTLGIPVVFLLFFSTVHVLPVGTGPPVDFLVPGILALAVMSTAMTALGIGTGFDRGYGVLKRLGATPLGRPRLLAAKIITVVTIELVQAAVLLAVGAGLGWSPGSGSAAVPLGAAAAMVLGTVAFCGVGLLLAGTLKPLVNLAVLNTLFVVLLLLGGMLIPLSKLPAWLADIARALPASALADALHRTLGAGVPVSAHDWLVLGVWAAAAPLVAGWAFRWE
jgi:ABC-2 type transport system ATP-binding protein